MSRFCVRHMLPEGAQDPYVLGTILASCSTVAIAIYCYRKNDNSQSKKRSTLDDEIVVNLLPIERVLAMGGGGDNAMSTFTWFKMTDKNYNHDKTRQFLQDRFYQLIKANPWMIGRILKRDGEHSLVYPKELWEGTKDGPMSEYFQCLEDSGVSTDTPYDQLGSKLSHLMLKTGPKEPLCRVTMLPPSSDKQHFAVVVTMSHVIGDGATFFKMNNMLLNVQEEIVSLNPQRITTTEEQQIEAMGGEAEYKILQSGGFIANMITGVLASVFKPSKKASARFYLVNQDGMTQEKEKFQYSDTTTKKKQYVSTNDVLSSWFFRNSTCMHGLMAINWRGRLSGHTDTHAGNYENVLFYRHDDFKTPDLIRKSISTNEKKQYGRQHVTDDEDQEPMPGFWGMASGTIALASNWASFSKPSSIPGWEEEMQIPLYDTSKLLPSTLAIMLIFRAGPRGTGVMVAGSPDKLVNLEKDVAFLSKEPL
ncbi:MAG: hypothetical protein SGBAC_009218 [Bacillariaceae sp.]